MSLFTVIEAAFIMIFVFVFSIVLEPLSPFPTELTYVIFGLIGILSQKLLIKAKAKWSLMNKKIDTQLGVLLIFVILLFPFIIEMFMIGFGVEGH